MAAPTKFAQRLGREPPEDCRDFLRTGRCKYGASCKYNHPPNVQSGGGIKAPLDSSEPPFPLRPGEPTCQYYLKHGTCKFGQACKFHHPPQSEMSAALLGSGSVMMNVGKNSKGGSEQIVLNSDGSSAIALQFLPQRPDEPDCIYFLRNGRCKYGATCRYHHPVSFQQSKPTDVHGAEMRRQQQQRPDDMVSGMNDHARSNTAGHVSENIQSSTSQYIRGQHLSSSYGHQTRQRDSGSSGGTPTHFVVTETPLAVMSGNAPGSYHRMAVGGEYSMPLNTTGRPGLMVPGRDFVSSSSSLASSYDTAVEMLPPSVQQGDVSTVMWSRPVGRTTSGGSLSAYDSTPPLRPQVPSYGSRSSLVPSVSDNSIASRGIRAESIGSASDSSVAYQDTWNTSSHSQSTPGRGWIETSSSFEQARRPRNPHFDRGERKMPQDSRYAQSPMQGRDPRTVADTESPDYGGLSMMTSALLNMLDTPEEAVRKSYTTADAPLKMQLASPSLTPRSGHASYSQALEEPPIDYRFLGSSSSSRETSRHNFVSSEYSFHDYNNVSGPSSSFPPALPYSRSEPSRNNTASDQNGPSPSWSPQRPSRAPGAPQPSSDVGLYLP